jgi:hypothetical protein
MAASGDPITARVLLKGHCAPGGTANANGIWANTHAGTILIGERVADLIEASK